MFMILALYSVVVFQYLFNNNNNKQNLRLHSSLTPLQDKLLPIYAAEESSCQNAMEVQVTLVETHQQHLIELGAKLNPFTSAIFSNLVFILSPSSLIFCPSDFYVALLGSRGCLQPTTQKKSTIPRFSQG